jgi:transposase
MTPMPEHIAQEVTQLDPTAQAVVRLLWHFHEEQMGELRKLREQLAARDADLAARQAHIDKLEKIVFGPRTEKMPSMAREVRRQVQAEELEVEVAADATTEEIAQAMTTARRKQGRKASEAARQTRKNALDRLPVLHEKVFVTPDQLPEGTTLADFRPLGTGEVVRRLEHVREHLAITEYQLQKMAEKNGDRIVQARAPDNVIDGGAWGPSVYAHVVVQKCVDSMPLYRQERSLGRAGFGIARSVLCDLFHRAAEVLKPIYDILCERVRRHPYVHADETTIRVAEPNHARNAWIWTALCEDTVVYAFRETRESEAAHHLLANSSGVLIADGYDGYNGVVGEGKRLRAGCWAHARRGFFEASKQAPEAVELLELIVGLYRIEHEAADAQILGTPAHLLLREQRSAELVGKLQERIDALRETTLPKSPLGRALTYAYNQRSALRAFLSDSKIPLDNNAAERALRIVAIGRKNFLFVGHQQAGQNLAILQSICSTCLLNGVDPYAYIKDVTVRVRSHPQSRIAELLPMNWQAPGG